jgi:hypothetical protein
MSCRILAILGVFAMLNVAFPQEKGLPSQIDLGPDFREFGLEPQAQGKRETCSLFAITAIANFEVARAGGRNREPLSVEFLTWAANEATGLSGDQAMFYEALHGLNQLGICTAELMPYEKTSHDRRTPSEAALANAKKLSDRWKVEWIKRWDVSRGLSADELRAIKSALASGHPVACGLRWPKAPRGTSIVEVPPPDDVRDGHSVVFTGYQDAQGSSDGFFRFRNSSGPEWGDKGYGVMSYAYTLAYANDALWLQLGAPGSEKPAERFEAEAMNVLAREKCETAPQDMKESGRGMWSQAEQLLCRAQPGGSVELGFEVREAGRYRVRVLATAAPDYGTIRVALDGKAQRPDFDLYAGRICPAGSLELGEHELTAGKHTLRVTAVGKNTGSNDYSFGLDAVDLIAARHR